MSLQDLNDDQVEVKGGLDKNTKSARYDQRVVESFDHLNLKKELLHGVYGYGFEKPSAIQKKCILPITTSNPPADVIGQAQSGTGKTATFSIAMLQRIDETKLTPQAIVVSPTRELAVQTHDVISKIGKYMNVKTHVCVGGTRVADDRAALSEGVHIAVGTPGRLTSMIEDEYLKVDDIIMIVIDEADNMLDNKFRAQLFEIFQYLPENLQVCLFSATLKQETLKITKKFMRNPIEILVKREQLTLDGIKQFYVNVGHDRYKYGVVRDLYNRYPIVQSVIFANKRDRVEWLAQQMTNDGFDVTPSHSGIHQSERMKTLHAFRAGSCRTLIASDLYGRGIDAHHVSLVINFDLPRKDLENYIHRIGRSGRYGRKGVSINLITDDDIPTHKEIESKYMTVIQPMPNDISEYLPKDESKM